MRACQPRNFIQPCLLLLLLDSPAHGYELIHRLHPFGLVDGDHGQVYRALRALERADLVWSDWAPSAHGPDRRVYHLTDSGRGALEEWVPALEQVLTSVRAYLHRYAAHGSDRIGVVGRREVAR